MCYLKCNLFAKLYFDDTFLTYSSYTSQSTAIFISVYLFIARQSRGLPACQVSSWSVQPFGHSAWTSQTDRQTGQTDRQRTDSIGRTVLQTVAQKSPILTYPTCIWGWLHWNFAKIFGIRELASMNYRVCCFRDPTFSHFGTIPACDGRTDGRTYGHSIYTALA